MDHYDRRTLAGVLLGILEVKDVLKDIFESIDKDSLNKLIKELDIDTKPKPVEVHKNPDEDILGYYEQQF